uniref:E3 ubiquitin-protein ligase n=1 Tax=Schistocephalus solidus TaxID=70667 RepID=A0A183SXM7_SCHSO
LQTHVARASELTANTERSHNRHHSVESSMSNRFRNNEAARLAAGLATYLVGGPRFVRNGGGGHDQLSDLTLFASCTGGGGPRRRRPSTTIATHQTSSGTILTLDRLSRRRSSCDCTPHDIGRLHKEFIQIPRDGVKASKDNAPTLELDHGTFWEWADRVLDEHASRKSELEIQFIGESVESSEQGTGIGPTLEFFSLVAAELRKKTGRMWVVNEEDFDETASEAAATDLHVGSANTLSDSLPQPGPSSSWREEPTEAEKDNLPNPEAKTYVKATNGLFPAPFSPDKIPESVIRRFYIMGIAVAKSLQDNRRIDLPLSTPFLKLISAFGNVRDLAVTPPSSEQTLHDQMKWFAHSESALDRINLRSIMTQIIGVNTSYCSRGHWITGLLDFVDFWSIDPERGRFFFQLCQFCQRKRRLQSIFPANGLTLEWLENAAIEVLGCKISDLGLEMEFIPSGQYSAEVVPLMDHYSWEPSTNVTEALADSLNNVESVTVYNVETYVRRTLEYCLDKGIRAQMDAFRDGFERVFRMDWLALFNPRELGQLICGDSDLNWTREDLLAYTVPCFGFTQNTFTFQLFISVLVDFNLEQRRAFLRFVTGCSTLPPGGLRNLSPRLRVVRKDAQQGPFPSVNTCAHYLKLPEYTSQSELCHYLLAATKESGFYLN